MTVDGEAMAAGGADGAQRFRALVDGATTFAVLGLDADGIVTDWSRGAERLLGWTAAEAVGQPGAIIFAPEDRAAGAPEHEMAEARARGAATGERWHARRDGSRFWASGAMELLPGGQGFVKLLRDLTPEREAAERQARMLDAVADGVYAMDAGWRITDMNAAAERHFGFRGGEAIGRDLYGLFPMARGSRFEAQLRDAMAGRTVTFEARSPVATDRVMEVRAAPRPGGGAIVSFTDISARRAAETRTRDSEARLRAALEISEMAEWVMDLRSGEVRHGEQMGPLFGLPAGARVIERIEEVLGHIHPDDRARVDAESQERLRRDGRYELEYRIVRADGSVAWVSTRGRLITDKDGPARINGVTRDVTARVLAQQAAAASAEALRQARAAGGIGAWSVEPLTGETWWSAEARAIFGVGPDVRVTRDLWQAMLHADGRDETKASVDRTREALAETFEQELHIVRNGEERWLLSRARAVAGPGSRLDGVVIDVTALKTAERDAAASRARLQAVYDNVPVGIVFAEAPSGRITDGNRAAEAILGHPVLPSPDVDSYGEWAAYRADGTWVPARDFPMARVLSTGRPAADTLRYERPDGERVWIRVQGAPVLDAAGEMTGALVAVTDIDGIVRAQEALAAFAAELETRVEAAVRDRERAWNASRDMLVVLTAEGALVAVNPAWTTITGWSADETVGRPFTEFIVPDDGRSLEALETAQSGQLDLFVNRCRCRDGSVKIIEWTAAPEGDFVYASGRDVTAERAQRAALADAEAQMHEMRKVETLGQLTGGVAHDFNNLLTPIMGGIDMLARRLKADDGAQRVAAAAMQSAERAKTLIQRLLAFGRRQALEPRTVDLAALLAGMRDLVARSVGPAVAVAVDASPALPPVRVDPNQLELALLNLAVNARDAMPEGGRLRFAAEPADAAPGVGGGRFVTLSVSDTGCGMDADTLARATEPFFTTKDVGQGTGLGLSMVFGLAAQSGGAFRLESAPGAGTTARLWLPVSEQAAHDATAALPAPSGRRHAGRVLLVDDEPLVRATVAEGLRGAGYQVMEAATPAAALARVKDGPLPDIMVTDQMMPGMTGASLAAAVRALHPAMPVLVITGYVAPGAADLAGLPVLAKPFRFEELANAIDALLPGAPSA